MSGYAQALKGKTYAEIQEELNRCGDSHLPALRISVLRNIVVEPIEPYLRYLGHKSGFATGVHFGQFDNVFQEAVSGAPDLLNQQTDFVLVFLNFEAMRSNLSREFGRLTKEEVDSETEYIKNQIKTILKGIRRQTGGMILWHSFEQMLYPALGIRDIQVESGQGACLRRLNEALRRAVNEERDCYLVDLNLCLLKVGARDFYDLRYWHLGRAPYSRSGLAAIAVEDFKFIRALRGKNKKCLVLDCDDTLWGGVIGEDGISGIRLGKTYPGSSYSELQQEILNLYYRGIIIAICSKNNEADVWEVFRSHPEMILREEHIATAQINWNDKATNLRQIAAVLNIGLDSMVFLDDSEFEVNWIRDVLPEVEVIHLPKERAVEHRMILASCGLFDNLTLSEEDKKRGQMYRDEGVRKRLLSESKSLEEYLKSLDMRLEVKFVDEQCIPRVAQLTQKTNQFNLTTRRYSEGDIRELANSVSSDVLSIRVKDRFGDSGLVGVCVTRYCGEMGTIDTLLLSCRVLGRGIEDAFLDQILRLLKAHGCSCAVGEFIPSKKNAQVGDFYQNRGFQGTSQADGIERFVLDLGRFRGEVPGQFAGIQSDVESRNDSQSP